MLHRAQIFGIPQAPTEDVRKRPRKRSAEKLSSYLRHRVSLILMVVMGLVMCTVILFALPRSSTEQHGGGDTTPEKDTFTADELTSSSSNALPSSPNVAFQSILSTASCRRRVDWHTQGTKKTLATSISDIQRSDCVSEIQDRIVLVYRSRFTEPSGYAEESLQFLRLMATARIDREVFVAIENDGPFYSQFFEQQSSEIQNVYIGRSDPYRLACAKQFPHILIHHGSAGDYECSSGRYCIGRVAYETDSLPRKWKDLLNEMNEIWVPSSFNVQTFRSSGVAPQGLYENVRSLPEPIDLRVYSPERVVPLESVSTLCPQGPRFLSVFAWNARKGWDVLLHSFLNEFGNDDTACLILRTFPKEKPRSNFSPSRAISSKDGNKQNTHPIMAMINNFSKDVFGIGVEDHSATIVVYSQYLTHEEMASLYKASDVFVLPTRGEGWGRPITEAMAMGMPVVATNWSGHLDFFSSQTGYPIDFSLQDIVSDLKGVDSSYAGHKWAEPSIQDLQRVMRTVLQELRDETTSGHLSLPTARKKALLAKRLVRERYGDEPMSKMLLSELKRVAQRSQPFSNISCNGKIDAVYTYVNGSMPHYADLKNARWDELPDEARRSVDRKSALGAKRSRDLSELRFSLRSLETNAPWINRIFIVTESPPSWLDQTNPRIVIVHPDTLLGAHSPSFNSHSLEAAIHRIPGLSECYLYLCDDYFIGHPITPAHFYDESTKCFNIMFETDRISISDDHVKPPSAHDAAFRNANRLLDTTFVRRRNFVPHAPHFFVKSIIQKQFPDTFSDAIENTIAQPFRSWEDIHIAFLFSHFLADRSIYAKDVCVNIIETVEKPSLLSNPTFTVYARSKSRGKRKYDEAIRELHTLREAETLPAFFSINDDMDAVGDSKTIELIEEVFHTLFPLRSSFEREDQ